LNFYLCSGIDPNENTEKKVNIILILTEVLSLLIHIVIRIRILAYKSKSKEDKFFNKFKKSFENQSLSDFTSNIVGVTIFATCIFTLLYVGNMSPEKANVYPNYLYIYMLHLYAPFCFSGYFGISYYIRHKPLRTVMRREIEDMIHEMIQKK
jgi:hypothetical protein